MSNQCVNNDGLLTYTSWLGMCQLAKEYWIKIIKQRKRIFLISSISDFEFISGLILLISRASRSLRFTPSLSEGMLVLNLAWYSLYCGFISHVDNWRIAGFAVFLYSCRKLSDRAGHVWFFARVARNFIDDFLAITDVVAALKEWTSFLTSFLERFVFLFECFLQLSVYFVIHVWKFDAGYIFFHDFWGSVYSS